jgi:hypothetical protein
MIFGCRLWPITLGIVWCGPEPQPRALAVSDRNFHPRPAKLRRLGADSDVICRHKRSSLVLLTLLRFRS